MENELSKERGISLILAGKAIFTVLNENLGMRYTYKVRAAASNNEESVYKCRWFVSLISGADNEQNYTYIGFIKLGLNRHVFIPAPIHSHLQSVIGFERFVKYLQLGKLPEFIKVHHSGFCLRCGRRLTVPESILSGFDPECLSLMGAV